MHSVAVDARRAPFSIRGAAFAGDRFQMVVLYPLSWKVDASTAPMAPNPRRLTGEDMVNSWGKLGGAIGGIFLEMFCLYRWERSLRWSFYLEDTEQSTPYLYLYLSPILYQSFALALYFLSGSAKLIHDNSKSKTSNINMTHLFCHLSY